jgi:Xaa-Pro dipeptidase
MDQSEPPLHGLEQERFARLISTMDRMGVERLLTADPINITYTTGVRNMNVFSMMGATRFLLVSVDGPTVMWEFAGSEHLSSTSTLVDEVRTAPGVTALSGALYRNSTSAFARELAGLCDATGGAAIAVERMDHEVTDALRDVGFTLTSATEVFVESRRIKSSAEIDAMRQAMVLVEAGVDEMLEQLRPGATEVEVWSALHRHLIAHGGEYVSTRLVQSGARTFPYFGEASSKVIESGDLFCIDTDAIGLGGYAVDFSRTYHVGPVEPSDGQRRLHALAREQLEHNAALLAPGRSFEDFASSAWAVPPRHAPFSYSSLAHGLGMSGEFPYVPVHPGGEDYPLDGEFEAGMVICVESYIGDPDLHQGVKLEDQFLITDSGSEAMSTLAFDPRLVARS